MHDTWGGRSKFNYTGDVQTGTKITFGRGQVRSVSAAQYEALRQHFLNQVVQVSTPREGTEGLGEWLRLNVTTTALASYVAPILVLEGYAVRVNQRHIKIIK